MKNKKRLALFAMAVSFSCLMTACGLGGDAEGQIVVESTPTPAPTEAPDPTPTIAPDAQSTTYTSKDKTISMKLPDATWANKTDEEDMVSFESPEQGKILILHGAGEEDMSVALVPSTQDMASSLEKAEDLEEGTDFEIMDYTAEEVSGINVYKYTVKYLSDKAGCAYSIIKVFANENEYYNIEATVKEDDAATLKKIRESVESFAIVGDSELKSAAPAKEENKTGSSAATDTEGTAGGEGTGSDAASSDSGDASAGTDSSASSDSATSDDTTSDSTTSESSGVIVNGGFSDEQLNDTNQTRTIYRNSDGHPLVIVPDGAGRWMDNMGVRYDFQTEEDVYDENGVDFYYHGEAANVYYMPVE